MLKARPGGGGIGMRPADKNQSWPTRSPLSSASARAISNTPASTWKKYIDRARHIEVQKSSATEKGM